MGRGKNYFNNNKGVALQGSKKGKASKMIACQYGAGCTRADCIYSHPHKSSTSSSDKFVQSKEPCMAYLVGLCAFTAKGCRKRHPGPEESERLIIKYSSINCKFGDGCLTNGCLYKHPSDEVDNEKSNVIIPVVSSRKQSQCTYNEICHPVPSTDVMGTGYNSEMSYKTNSGWTDNELTHAKMGGGLSANWAYDEFYTASYNSGNIIDSTTAQAQYEKQSIDYQKQELSQEGKNIHAPEFVPGSWKRSG